MDGKPKNASDETAAIQTGDLVAVEKLFTGAGDFERLRVVGLEEKEMADSFY